MMSNPPSRFSNTLAGAITALQTAYQDECSTMRYLPRNRTCFPHLMTFSLQQLHNARSVVGDLYASIYTDLERRVNALARINTLPNELLTRIFMFATTSQRTGRTFLLAAKPKKNSAKVDISTLLVLTRLRAVAQSDDRLPLSVDAI